MAAEMDVIAIPHELFTELQDIESESRRSEFVETTLRDALRRRRELLELLTRKEPVMRDEDYPELAAIGTVAWVKNLRGADEEHLRQLQARYEQRK